MQRLTYPKSSLLTCCFEPYMNGTFDVCILHYTTRASSVLRSLYVQTLVFHCQTSRRSRSKSWTLSADFLVDIIARFRKVQVRKHGKIISYKCTGLVRIYCCTNYCTGVDLMAERWSGDQVCKAILLFFRTLRLSLLRAPSVLPSFLTTYLLRRLLAHENLLAPNNRSFKNPSLMIQVSNASSIKHKVMNLQNVLWLQLMRLGAVRTHLLSSRRVRSVVFSTFSFITLRFGQYW